MRSFQYLADGHHVDDAGNLISCTYVDLRDPLDRSPITTLNKASSSRHAIPGCETIRLLKPSCFLGRGEGLIGSGEAVRSSANDEPATAVGDSAGTDTADEVHCGTNGWIYCAFLEPETEAERAAWRAAMPREYEAVSLIRRPREFARALGAMAAEQVGPRGRTVLLRNTVDGRTFCTTHRSQMVYHGPVVYPDDPSGRLERASSDLEVMLLPIFMKHAAHRAQREYRFAVWAEEEPNEDRVDLEVSPALIDAVQKPRKAPEGSGFVSAGLDESTAVEEVEEGGGSRTRVRVEALPAFAGFDNPTVRPRRYDERLPDDLRETMTAYAAIDALRGAVAGSDASGQRDAAAAAWHAEPVVRFFCSTFPDGIVGVRVSKENFIVITAEFSGDDLIETSIAVGPEGTCACKMSVGETHLASAAPDVQSFERVLKDRLAEMGVLGEGGGVRG